MSVPYSRVAHDHWDHLGTLSFEARAVLAYLLTCKHRNAAQAFRAPSAYICADMAATPEQIEGALEELETSGRIVRGEDVILVVNGHRHDPPGNTNQALHRVNLWRSGSLPEGPPTLRAATLRGLAVSLERCLEDMRPIKGGDSDAAQRRAGEEQAKRDQVARAIVSMRQEAESLSSGGTVPEGFPKDSPSAPDDSAKGSEIVPESRARDVNDNVNDNVNDKGDGEGDPADPTRPVWEGDLAREVYGR